ncbi:MAG TPA: hypothetical protein VIF83_00680 [Gemmatimonadaceae bacterium]|jgi:hypothetical protein
MSAELRHVLGFLLLLVIVVAGIAVVSALYMMFRRKTGMPVERTGWFPGFSKTFSFSIGGPPGQLPDAASLEDMQRTQPLDPHVREHYRRYWERAKDRFEKNPVEGLKEAQDVLTDLMKERGSSAVSLSEKRVAAMDLLQAVGSMSDIFGTIDNARSAARGMAAAREGSDASVEDLRQAMAVYESAFEKLLAE